MLVAGSGDRIGKTISLFLSPAIGPTTKMFVFSLLYGCTNTPLVFALISAEIRSLGANLKPSGRIKTAPTLRGPLVPPAVICLTEVS